MIVDNIHIYIETSSTGFPLQLQQQQQQHHQQLQLEETCDNGSCKIAEPENFGKTSIQKRRRKDKHREEEELIEVRTGDSVHQKCSAIFTYSHLFFSF